jgi:3-deoxy-D-manno-octulosonic-acid transferase
VFRESQPFFQWYGGFHRKMLQSFSYLFVQDKNSVELLSDINITNVAVTGDTRFDRVLSHCKKLSAIDIVDRFCASHPVIVAGSTWTDDDEELDHYANTNPHIRFIIAPHDISKARIDECLNLYKNAITFSEEHTNNGQSFNDQRSTSTEQRSTINDQRSTSSSSTTSACSPGSTTMQPSPTSAVALAQMACTMC